MASLMVRASRVSALLVGAFFPPRRDLVLEYIKTMHQGAVGWIDASKIDLGDHATSSWIDAQHERLGRPAGASVRLGYYLFLDGQVAAYHSGLVDFKRDKLSLGAGLVAAIAGLCWENTFLLNGAFRATHFQASLRVLQFFEAAITGRQPHAPHWASPPPPPAQEAAIDPVELAFEVLGLAPSATQDEVKARYRALAKEWHPDRFTNDAPKFTEAGARMTQINAAYSVVCDARGGR
jgi:hypothetical protein